MSQEALNTPQIVTALPKMPGKAMPKHMRSDRFLDPDLLKWITMIFSTRVLTYFLLLNRNSLDLSVRYDLKNYGVINF